jgi:hypothetical protein
MRAPVAWARSSASSASARARRTRSRSRKVTTRSTTPHVDKQDKYQPDGSIPECLPNVCLSRATAQQRASAAPVLETGLPGFARLKPSEHSQCGLDRRILGAQLLRPKQAGAGTPLRLAPNRYPAPRPGGVGYQQSGGAPLVSLHQSHLGKEGDDCSFRGSKQPLPIIVDLRSERARYQVQGFAQDGHIA